MSFMSTFTRRVRIQSVLVAIMVGGLTACGGGGDGGAQVGVGIVVPGPQPNVAPLALNLSRVGPEVIGLDWSDDPYVASFLIVRDGNPLTSVTTLNLDDASVYVNYRYCYQVQGYDARGVLIASSSIGCITVVP